MLALFFKWWKWRASYKLKKSIDAISQAANSFGYGIADGAGIKASAKLIPKAACRPIGAKNAVLGVSAAAGVIGKKAGQAGGDIIADSISNSSSTNSVNRGTTTNTNGSSTNSGNSGTTINTNTNTKSNTNTNTSVIQNQKREYHSSLKRSQET